MAGRLRTFKPDEQIVQKICENPDCEKQFFVTSRYAAATRFCSNKCLQHNFYLSRKVQDAEINDPPEQDNQLNTNDMDQMEKILELKDQINEAKTKLLLQERDLQELTVWKTRATNAENKLSAISEEYESLKLINDDTEALRDTLSDTEATNRALLDDITELKWACLSLQAAGMPVINGKIISMATVQKFFGKEYSVEKAFKIKVWGFELSHQAGSQEVIIKKV
jgi:hypothetical protein